MALRDVVILGGLALQSADCAIRAAGHQRGEQGGLALIENERFHQFIIWQAVRPRWQAVMEKYNRTDLTLERDEERHLFEMKNWTGAAGNRQIPAINRDVTRLQHQQQKGKGNHHGYILVTSMNPLGMTDENLQYLLNHVTGLNNDARELFRFPTKNQQGTDYEFWVCGWPVLPPPQAPAPEQAG